MKILFDFLPLLLFFGALKFGEHDKDWANTFVNAHFSGLVSGGTVSAADAPVLLATLVMIVATLAQVAVLAARGKKIDLMLWITLGLVVVLGGATVWFHNQAFIMWKPTLLYWLMALGFALAGPITGKNPLQSVLGAEMTLPQPVWHRLTAAWVAFFAAMGALNLWVAFHFSLDAWANFKVFGSTALMVVFVIAQGLYLGRYLEDEPSAGGPAEPKP